MINATMAEMKDTLEQAPRHKQWNFKAKVDTLSGGMIRALYEDFTKGHKKGGKNAKNN